MISPTEARSSHDSLKTVIDGSRRICVLVEHYDTFLIEAATELTLKTITVDKIDNSPRMVVIFTNTYTEKANELISIMKRFNGYLPATDQGSFPETTPYDVYQIGLLLEYYPKEVYDFIVEKNWSNKEILNNFKKEFGK